MKVWSGVANNAIYSLNKKRNKKLARKLRRLKKKQRNEFYESREWLSLRYRALKLAKGCCECCGARAEKGRPLHVDHIKPRSKFPSLELEITNLQVLCGDCNMGKSNWDQTDWRSRVLDDYAEAMARDKD